MRLLALLLPAVAFATTVHININEHPQPPFSALESWTYEDCGLGSSVIHVNSIEISPDPPKPGQSESMTVDFTVASKIYEGAYARVTVKLGLIKLLSKQFDLCEEKEIWKGTGLQCPLEAGHYRVTKSVNLPKEIPPAKYTVYMLGYTSDEEELFCLNVRADFLRKFPSSEL